MFKTLILHYPDQALDKIEEVSYLLKHSQQYQMEQFLKVVENRKYSDVCEQMKDYISVASEQFGGKKPAGEEEGEEAEVAEVPPVGLIPDLLEDSHIYQWAGIGFGK